MQHIFLSPHFDDAALSCGGTIAQLATAGKDVVVATIFGGKPDPAMLSPFAQSIHARPGATDDLMTQRVAEEHSALAILGPRPRPGSYLDCIYRQVQPSGRWLYDSEGDLFGPVDPADGELIEELAAVFATLAPSVGQCVIYAPLAVGNHVDHQVVQQAALVLRKAGYELLFYEDYPYVVRDPASLHSALERLAPSAGWTQRPVILGRADLDRKIAAVSAYTSQLGVLFGIDGAAESRDVASALDGLARYTAHEAAAGRFAEQYWSAGN